MRTDIPLKTLTTLRAADLLPLLGTPDVTLLRVQTLELPAAATRLDTILRLRSPAGQEYLHILEWQGYPDPVVLWRVLGYLAWVKQQNRRVVVVCTIIYLTPDCDAGDTLVQTLDGVEVQRWSLACIRLWQQDAATAVASQRPGLAVLSPLMQHSSGALVEQAARLVMERAPQPQQADLLSILGVFAEPLIDSRTFVRFVGRERLMESDLLTYLMQEKTEELKTQLKTQYLAEGLQQGIEQGIEHMQQALEAAFISRFPDAPVSYVADIRRITEPAHLHRLLVALVQARSLEQFVPLLTEVSTAPQHGQ
jgi:hypothetical protein